MTVDSTVNSSTHTGTGSVSTYPYEFRILDRTHLEVTQISDVGEYSTLVLDTDYDVDGVGDDEGGNVLLTDDLPTDYVIVARRVLPLTQLVDVRNLGGWFPSTNEDIYDAQVMIAQQLQEQLDRVAILPVGSDADATLPDPEALKLLRWNADADALENVDPADIVDSASTGDFVVDAFVTGVDFTPGVTTTLTLSEAPGTVNNVDVLMDGVGQLRSTLSLAGLVLTFNAVIPVGVRKIEVKHAHSRQISMPGANTVDTQAIQAGAVTTAKLADGAVTTAKLADEAVTEDKLDADYLSAAPQYGRNAIINGGALVANRTAFASPVTGVFHYGLVDRWKGALTGGGLVGTFTQGTGSSLGRTGYTCKWSGVTITGVGSVTFRQYIEARDAARFKNRIASASAQLRHDAGVSLNATLKLYKANAADNFAAVTAISINSPQVAATGTNVSLYSRAITMGDCSTGFYIDVVIDLPAGCSNKNFECVELQLELGDTETEYEYRHVGLESWACLRYYYRLEIIGGYGLLAIGITTQLANTAWHEFPQVMRVSPTVAITATDWTINPGAVAANGGATTYSERGFDQQFSTAAAVLTANTLYRIGAGAGTPRITFDADF